MREQKMEEQRHHQEERMKRALERAQADAKRNVSRKKMQLILRGNYESKYSMHLTTRFRTRIHLPLFMLCVCVCELILYYDIY